MPRAAACLLRLAMVAACVAAAAAHTILVESAADPSERHAIFIPHSLIDTRKLQFLQRQARRHAKQLIGASVVTSVSVLRDDDPEDMKRQREREYKEFSTEGRDASVLEPTFKLYLYDDSGRLVQELLSIHDIQQLLLASNRSYGVAQLNAIRGKNAKASPDVEETTTKGSTTLSGIVDRVQSIVASAQTTAHQSVEEIPFVQLPVDEALTPKPDVVEPPPPIKISSGPIPLWERRPRPKEGEVTLRPVFKRKKTTTEAATTTSQGEETTTATVPPTSTTTSTTTSTVGLVVDGFVIGNAWLDNSKRDQMSHIELSKDASERPPLPQITMSLQLNDGEKDAATTQSPEQTKFTTWQTTSADKLVTWSSVSTVGDTTTAATTKAPELIVTYQQVTVDDQTSTEAHTTGAGVSSVHEENALGPPQPDVHEHHHEDHAHGHDHGHHHHDHGHGFHPTNLPKKEIPVAPEGNVGLRSTVGHLSKSEQAFVDVNNELAFKMYRALLASGHGGGNMVYSPLSTSTSLAMIFLGARGSTSWQINEILKFDEMISFNPHLLYKNITDLIANEESNWTAACAKLLFFDKHEDPLIEFYKARVDYFYSGSVDQVDFAQIEDEVRKRVNALMETKTKSLVKDFVEHDHPNADRPMAFFAANFFRGSWKVPVSDSDLTTLDFINLPRGRRLVSVPALSVKAKLNAGYYGDLDVTAVEWPYAGDTLSLVLVLPGKQTEFIAGGLSRFEDKLNSTAWDSLMASLHPVDLDFQLPLFAHRSSLQLNDTLKALGLEDAFTAGKADFTGINGGLDLHLSSFLQLNLFEVSKDSSSSVPRARRQSDDAAAERFQLHLNRQFLYALRHNPTGMVLFVGRYYEPQGAHAHLHQSHDDVHHHHH